MPRPPLRQLAATTGLMAVLLLARPGGSASGPDHPIPLPKGWGWLLVRGTVSRIDPAARTATVAIIGQGRAETFEGGSEWRRQAVTGSQVVHLLVATVISDAGGDAVPIAALRAGAPLTVWAVIRPDASALGLKVLMASGSPTSAALSTSAPFQYGVLGAVVHSSGGMIEVVTAQGSRRSVILTGTTIIRNAAGAVVHVASLAPYDVVRVEGTVNADGSVAATHIDVELTANRADRVSGPVDQIFAEVGGLVVAGVMVPLQPGCFFFKGSGPGAFRQLAPGQPVTVYGASISAGPTLVGLRARVVVAR